MVPCGELIFSAVVGFCCFLLLVYFNIPLPHSFLEPQSNRKEMDASPQTAISYMSSFNDVNCHIGTTTCLWFQVGLICPPKKPSHPSHVRDAPRLVPLSVSRNPAQRPTRSDGSMARQPRTGARSRGAGPAEEDPVQKVEGPDPCRWGQGNTHKENTSALRWFLVRCLFVYQSSSCDVNSKLFWPTRSPRHKT